MYALTLGASAHSGPGKQISYTFSIDEKLALFYKPHFTYRRALCKSPTSAFYPHKL